MTKWKALEYARISELQRAMAEEVLERLDLKGNEHILDIGGGNGKNPTEISSSVPQGSAVSICTLPESPMSENIDSQFTSDRL